jgi:hypothetical protein
MKRIITEYERVENGERVKVTVVEDYTIRDAVM